MKKLFVGNLSFRTTESELRALFEPFGEVSSVHIATDRDTGRARGFGFVEMADDQAANTAIDSLNGREVNGRALNVNEARPKVPGGPKFGGGGGGGGRGGRDRDDSRRGPGGSRREPRW